MRCKGLLPFLAGTFVSIIFGFLFCLQRKDSTFRAFSFIGASFWIGYDYICNHATLRHY